MHLNDYDGDNDVGLHQNLFLVSASEIENDFTKNCIVLDEGSCTSIFSDENLFSESGSTSRSLKLETNGGKSAANKMGFHHGLRVWSKKGSITNVLSLSEVSRKCRVTMESRKDPDIEVEMEPGKWMRFALKNRITCVWH